MNNMEDLHFRSVVLRFSVQNILDRTDDAVAIACDKEFSMGGGLGRAFLNRGNTAQLTNDIQQLRNSTPRIQYPIALSVPASGLQCRNLILVPLRQFFNQNFKDVFSEVFQCAINLGATSLAFPPLGTGGFNMERSLVAEAMQSAFKARLVFGSLTQITLVDSSENSVRYYRNVLENMVADDLINNPRFYATNLPAILNQAGPSNNNEPAGAFSLYYKSKELADLKELRKKRIEDKMQIDTPNRDEEEQLEACPVCLGDMLKLDEQYDKSSDMGIVQLTQCTHLFHRRCLVAWFETKAQCPICNTQYLPQLGTQPSDGTMVVDNVAGQLPGYNDRRYIQITYNFPNGTQKDHHPRPGTPYKGTNRVCYLPNTREGQNVLRLLREAFNRRLVFTVGDSVTTGQMNVVIWNGIHHKTNKNGGPDNYGYPDPDYLDRVKRELASIGITENLIQNDDTSDDSDAD